ncbi:MAG TPA: hypothetical protein VGC82_21075, partial [Rhodopila sp.]
MLKEGSDWIQLHPGLHPKQLMKITALNPVVRLSDVVVGIPPMSVVLGICSLTRNSGWACGMGFQQIPTGEPSESGVRYGFLGFARARRFAGATGWTSPRSA